MVKKLSLDRLSAEDKQRLMDALKEQQDQAAQQQKQKREQYKSLVSETVTACLPVLQQASELLRSAKQKVFDEFKTLVQIKGEVYDLDQDQYSYTFTNADGSTSIMIGYRLLDGWDDTAEVGIKKVNNFLSSLAKDPDSDMLSKMVQKLLSKDNKGNLKASRVLQLQKMAEDRKDETFIDGIRIIRDAYRPKPTKLFLSCFVKNATGEKVQLPLDMTEAAVESDFFMNKINNAS